MTELIVAENDAGQRADRFLAKAFPRLTAPLVAKLMRKKRIKLNGAKTEPSVRIRQGDVFRFYLGEELLSADKAERASDFRSASPDISVVYEDENILLVDKPVGTVVHDDNDNSADTLIDRILCYLWKKGEYDPDKEQSFVPALCNRIDRNTCGIVAAAKNAEALRILNSKIRDREVTKRYLCVVSGTPEKRADTLTAYLKKLPDENRVIVSDEKREGFLTIKTKYTVLESRGEQSLLDVDLLTGRTHQIRAHFAHIGHPLLGDGKYGSNRLNKQYGYKYQALCAYRIEFRFTTDAGKLAYLNNRCFDIADKDSVWFVKLFKSNNEKI